MTLTQFKSLAQAYGSNFRYWPNEYQRDAASLLNTHFAKLREILDAEASLDALLVSHNIAPATTALFASIISSAPQPKLSFWQKVSAWFRSVNWSSPIFSLHMAGVALASTLAGAFCVSVFLSGMLPDSPDIASANAEYVDFGNDWIR